MFAGRIAGLTIVAACLGFGPGALAANLVVDGGFEADASGNYSAPSYLFNLGPSSFGPAGVWHVNSGFVGIDSFAVQAHSGNNSLLLAPGNPSFPSSLTQTLATTAGATYAIDFFAAAAGVNTFSLTFNGVAVAGAPTSFPTTIPMFATDFSQDYREYTFNVVASSSLSVLGFGGTSTGNPGFGPTTINIDDISVTPIASAVPEPASMAILSFGMFAVATLRRRSRT